MLDCAFRLAAILIAPFEHATFQRLASNAAVLACAASLAACSTFDAASSSSNSNEPDVAVSASGAAAPATVKWQSAIAFNAPTSSSSSDAPAAAAVQWQHRTFPGKKAVLYRTAVVDGRSVIASESNASASMLRQSVRIEPARLASVKFSWKVPALIADADLADADKSDSPVRLVLAFEGDRSKFSAKDAMVSELALTLTGEAMPYATLMYVWSNKDEVGRVIKTRRTDRMQKMVVESGAARLGQWLDYERDVRADFVKAFGEEPGALVGVGIMSDTDNTRGQARAWYGPISLSAHPLASVAAADSHARPGAAPGTVSARP
jgi:hypothetical protein